MITRRGVLLAGGAGLLVAHRSSLGQPAATIRRVGILTLPSEPAVAPQLKAFAGAMRDLGWTEGKNVEYRFVYANGDMNRLDALAGALVQQGVEIILAPSAPSVRAGEQHPGRRHAPKTVRRRSGQTGCGLRRK